MRSVESTASEALLAPLEGRVPERPDWFEHALAFQPERTMVDVTGCAIETLRWGRADRPGLVLLHGKMAHADWWRFIAPYFAETHQVVAMSFSGMGGSGWRDNYAIEEMADEVMAVSAAHGLQRPVIVGHSFGAFVSLVCAARHGAQLAGVVTLDMPLMSSEQRAARAHPPISKTFEPRPTKIYRTLPEALARFRFAPPQRCDHLYIADFIARTSLKEVEGGWTWRFDPKVAGVRPGNAAQHLRDAACPMAVSWGAESALVVPEVAEYIAGIAPTGTPQIAIPGARHHVMVDQPLALVAALRSLFAVWPYKP